MIDQTSTLNANADTIAQLQAHVIGKAQKDDAFRQALLADAKAALEKELGVKLPEELKFQVVESPINTVTIALPYQAANGELSDADLEAVAGGSKATANLVFGSLITVAKQVHGCY